MTESEEMVCRELVETITDYLEGAMPESERQRFERHLEGCPGCRLYLDQMLQTVTALGALPADDVCQGGEAGKLLALFRDWDLSRPYPDRTSMKERDT